MLYKINKNKIDRKILDEAIDIFEKGGVIIYPTDTAYALGCDIENQEAVKKIFKIKKRDTGKSLPVIVGSFDMAEDFFLLNEKEKELGERFWDNFNVDVLEKGKLSIVLKVKKNIAITEAVIANDGTVAVRVPNSIWARSLSLKLKKPIISTSANLSGTSSCYSIVEIKKSGAAYQNVDLILDAGLLPRVMPSTIVRVKNGKVEVLREGSGGGG